MYTSPYLDGDKQKIDENEEMMNHSEHLLNDRNMDKRIMKLDGQCV